LIQKWEQKANEEKVAAKGIIEELWQKFNYENSGALNK
jgi:hypothetical protein